MSKNEEDGPVLEKNAKAAYMLSIGGRAYDQVSHNGWWSAT